MTAYRVSTPYERVQFSILVTSFQKKTGVKLDKGKIYHIKGTIGEICAFEKRLFKSPKVVIVVPATHLGSVFPGNRYDLGIISIEERSRVTVTRHLDGAVVSIRKSTLESMGVSSLKSGKEVVEFTLRPVSGTDRPLSRVFANIQQSNGFIRFNVDGIGARPSDIFEVVSERKYNVRDFVREFNSRKPDEARNVKLMMDWSDTLCIDVDGKRFPFTEYTLFRAASRLLLRTKLSFYKMELRFWFDGEQFEIRFGVDRVAGIRIWKGKIKFDNPVGVRADAAQREFYSQDQGVRNSIWRQFEQHLRMLQAVSMPEGVTGTYVFEVDAASCRFVCRKLEKATRNEYSTRKGAFGEMISSHILSLRYPEICEHPAVKFPKVLGCHKQGVDYQMRRGDSGDVDLFEFKWWKNVMAAINQGRIQARKRLAERSYVD